MCVSLYFKSAFSSCVVSQNIVNKIHINIEVKSYLQQQIIWSIKFEELRRRSDICPNLFQRVLQGEQHWGRDESWNFCFVFKAIIIYYIFMVSSAYQQMIQNTIYYITRNVWCFTLSRVILGILFMLLFYGNLLDRQGDA